MVTKTEMCNLALIEAKEDTEITDIDEGSVSARRLSRIYDVTRREVLSGYRWSFATKFKSLARSSATPDGYNYTYVYPSDSLRLINVYSSEDEFKLRDIYVPKHHDNQVIYDGGSKYLATDLETPFVEYISDVTSESLFDPLFTRLFYLYLAMKLSKLTGSDANIKTLSEEIAYAERTASLATVGESENSMPIENHYVDVRE